MIKIKDFTMGNDFIRFMYVDNDVEYPMDIERKERGVVSMTDIYEMEDISSGSWGALDSFMDACSSILRYNKIVEEEEKIIYQVGDIIRITNHKLGRKTNYVITNFQQKGFRLSNLDMMLDDMYPYSTFSGYFATIADLMESVERDCNKEDSGFSMVHYSKDKYKMIMEGFINE